MIKNISLVFTFVLFLTSFQLKTYASETRLELKPKNVIIFIGDGCGQNSWKAHDLNEGVTNRFDDSWVKNKVATQSMTSLEAGVVYDEEKAQGPDSMKWRKRKYTDSAASGTALATGVKTYNGRINIDINKLPLTSLSDIASQNGKSAGIISTVQISHATPATFGGARNISRENYKDIGDQMLTDTVLTLLIGAGHPYYNANGSECMKINRNYDYVGGKNVWNSLANYNWTLLNQVDSFTSFPKNAQRILGMIPNRDALDPEKDPSLALLTCNAVDYLVQNPKGFTLMVEGGAIDRANHYNDKKQMLLEMKGFTDAIKALTHKIDAGESGLSWKDTLVIITSDHETGFILFEKEGDLDSLKYHSYNHTNELVLLFAKGVESNLFRTDSPYIDNTQILRNITREVKK